MLVPVSACIAERGARAGQKDDAFFPPLGREQLFVLSRALMGTICSAVLEEQPFFGNRTFEDELVRLLLAYLADVTERQQASTVPA